MEREGRTEAAEATGVLVRVMEQPEGEKDEPDYDDQDGVSTTMSMTMSTTHQQEISFPPSSSSSCSSSASSTPVHSASASASASASVSGRSDEEDVEDDEDQDRVEQHQHLEPELVNDTLSEEAEEDLANNNDPNNNAGDLGAPPMENANLVALPPPATSASTAVIPSDYNAATTSSSSSRQNCDDYFLPASRHEEDLHMEEANEYVLEQLKELDKTAEDRREELRKELEDNTRLILKVFPKKSFHEVYSYLEAYHNKPNRVEIVLNEFIEQGGSDEIEDTQQMQEDDDEEYKKQDKGKAGNGMKSKNRRKGTSEASSTTVKPLLDLNLDKEEERWRRRDGYDEEEKRASKRKSDDVVEADQSSKKGKGGCGKNKGKGKGKGKTSTERSRKDADLSENLIYGPFDFSAHRQEKGAKSTTLTTNSFIRHGSQDESFSQDRDKRGEETPGIKSPEVVDLLGDETPSRAAPPVVDISSADTAEKRELFNSFKNMFPDTPVAYLEEQAEELAGKPAATERFVEELLSRGCQPPDYWKPAEKVVTVIGDEGTPMDWDPIIGEDGEKKPASDNVAKTVADTANVAGRLENINAEIALLEQEYAAKVQKQQTDDAPDLPIEDTIAIEAVEEAVLPAAAQQQLQPETEEEKIDSKFSTLQQLFPQADPEFLHQKVQELIGDEGQFNRWVDESLENKGKDFPTREAYEKRLREAKLMEQYSQEVTAEEILKMYDDPVAYFSDMTRKVSDLYKRHAIGHLKKVFRNVSANAINKSFSDSNSLYYPSYKKLMALVGSGGRKSGNARKTKRPDHECSVPAEIDINFLKEMQFARIEKDIEDYKKGLEDERLKKINEAREKEELVECSCCYNDECLLDDMLYCPNSHMFCKECVQRASEVAIGEGKTSLTCLGQCDAVFELAALQKALKANVFSKWLRKIQLAEVEKADMDGLERCPFCDFATIMDTSPEENKVFQCRDSECGKESCRLCKEISHIPLRCEEVEKDAEVRKRTYIENKMTEALIRKCWKCSKPFLKSDGCNKMTCECGAQMCYLCRKPVRDYNHFYGQGGHATATQTCPLWSNSEQIHETEVARGALEAKTEMDQQEPDVHLKHDPTMGVNMEKAVREEMERTNRANQQQQNRAALAGVEGLENILGHDVNDHERIVREQLQIEQMIRQGRNNEQRPGGARLFGQPGPAAGPPWQQPNWNWPNAAAPGPAPYMAPHHHHHHQQLVPEIHRGWHEGFVNRMGELLQMREVERRRHRMIRQRERQALEDFHQHVNRAPAAPAAPAAVILNQQQPQRDAVAPAPAAHPAGPLGNIPPAVPNVLPNNQPGGMWHHRQVPQGPPLPANQQQQRPPGLPPFQIGVAAVPKHDGGVLRAPVLQPQPPHAPRPAHQNPAIPFHQMPAAAAGPAPLPPAAAGAGGPVIHPWGPGAPPMPTFLAEQRRRVERELEASTRSKSRSDNNPFEVRAPRKPPNPPHRRIPPAAALGAPPPPPTGNDINDDFEALLDTL